MSFNDVLQYWLGGVGEDLRRYIIFAFSVWFILWVALAAPLANRKIRPDRPKLRQMIIEFGASLRSIAVFSTVGLLTFALDRAGLLYGPHLGAQWGLGWGIASILLMIIGHDAYFYWTHRLMHRPALFRIFHRRHHRSNNPSPFTAYSFDIGEAVVQTAFVPLWMILTPTPWWATGIFMLHQIVRNTIGHAGYELFPARGDGRPMFDFITTVTHHDLHHAQAGWNYGLYFTWWDRLMDTEHPEYYARFAAATRTVRPASQAVEATS